MTTNASVLHPFDKLHQTLLPTEIVPKKSPFEPLKESGTRLLVASSGLWFERKNSWMYLMYPLAIQYAYNIPYGDLERSLCFIFDSPPSQLLNQFKQLALLAGHTKVAAWITWHPEHGFRYQQKRMVFMSGDLYKFENPPLSEGEEVAFELFSNGRGPAMFAEDHSTDQTAVFQYAVGTTNTTLTTNLVLRVGSLVFSDLEIMQMVSTRSEITEI